MSRLQRLVVELAAEIRQYMADMGTAATATEAAGTRIERANKGMAEAAKDVARGQADMADAAVQVAGRMGPMGGAVAAAAAVVAGYALVSYKAAQENTALVRAIALSGNQAGVTAGQLHSMAAAASDVVGTHGQAAQAIGAMVGNGKVAAENLQALTVTALNAQRTLGMGVEDTVKRYEELGEAPTKASRKLNEAMGYLNAETYRRIQALEDMGKKDEAAALAQLSYAKGLDDATKKVEASLGTVQRAWRSVGEAATWAWDKFLGLGRKDEAQDSLDKLRAELAGKERQLRSGFANTSGGAAVGLRGTSEARRSALEADAEALREQIRLLGRAGATAAQNAADSAKWQAAKIEALDRNRAAEKLLMTQADKRAEAMKLANEDLKLGYITASEHAVRVAAAEKQFADQVHRGNDGARERAALLKAQQQGLDDLINAILAREKAEHAADLAASKALADVTERAEKAALSSAEQVEKQLELNAAIGLTRQEVVALESARLEEQAASKERRAALADEIDWSGKLGDALRDEAAALYALAKAKRDGAAKQAGVDADKRLQRQVATLEKEGIRAAERIEESLTDALMRGFESGKGFAANLVDTVSNLFRTLVLRPIVSAIVSPVAGAITGAMGLPGAANAATSAGNLMGAGAGLYNSFATSSVGGALGLSVPYVDVLGAGAAQSGILTSAGSSIGAALPWIGGILAVASLIKSLDKGKTYHSGGLGSYSAAGGSAVGDAVKGQGLDFDLSSRDYRAASEGAAVDMARAVVGLLDSTASTFGKEAGYYAATAFADDSSKSGAWGALMLRLGDKVLLDWGKGADKWPGREFADGEAGAKEYAAAVAKDVRDYLITQTPDWADAMLSALGDTPTLENLSAVVGQINQAATALEGMGRASQAFAAMTDAATAALIKGLGGGASAASVLDGYYQAFYTEQERTALATARLTEQMAALGVAMPKDHVAFRALVDAAIASGKPELAAALINLSGAFNAVTSTAGTAADAAARAAAATTQALRAAIDREKQQWQTAADAASTLRDEVQGIFDVLADGISGLRADAWGTEGTAAVAQRYITDSIAAAMTTGVLPDAAGLADAIGAARTGISGGQYASDAERSYAALVLAGQLETLHAVAGDQLTEAERQYRAAQTQIEQLDKTLAYWQQQVDLSQGQIDEIKTVAEAVRDLQETLKPGSTGRGGAGGNGARGGVMLNTSASSMDAYRSLAEGPPTVYTRDANGNGGSFQDTANWAQVGGRWINISGQTMANEEDYWAARLQHAYDSPAADMASTWQQLTSGMFAGDASRLIAAARGAGLSENVIASYVHEFMPKLAVGTNYIPEDGPYYLHKGEAVQPAAYNPVLGNGGAMANTARLEAAFARFEARMASVEGAIREGNRHAATTADVLDSVRDGNALVSKNQESVFA